MSRAQSLTLVLILCCAAAPSVATGRAVDANRVVVSVVATTDLHGGIIQRGERGGLALLGGYLRNIRAARARDRGGVLLVDSGDMFQGTLESNLNEGAVVVAAYNRLGYAAAAVGNHEFDFGPVGPDAMARTPGDDPRGALKARARDARFPFLAANVIDDSTGRPVAWPNVKPSTTVTTAGITVGIIGVTTPQTAVTTIAENLRGLSFAPIVPTVIREATALRSRGASVVVVLAHAGGQCTRLDDPEAVGSCDQAAEILNVARQLPPGLVDVIAAGHTHQAMAHDVGGIAIVEAYSAGRAFARVDLVIERKSRTVIDKQIFAPRDLCAREDSTMHACDASARPENLIAARYENLAVTPDDTVAAAIAPAVSRAADVKGQALGVLVETSINVAPRTESALADLFADGMLAAAHGSDVAIGNGGALRTDLPAGRLTFGEVYEVYPFDNRLVTVTMTGGQLARIVAHNLQRVEAPFEILSIAGFRVNATCDSGMLRVALTRQAGEPIDPADRLTVVTSDFVASGGDGVLAPAGPLGEVKNVEGAPILHDAVADWLRRRGGTLTDTQILSPANRRWTYPGQRPVSCS